MDIPFVFAGKGELEEEVNGVSNVMNTGFQKEGVLSLIIQKAAFTVFPSEWYENGPFAVIESIMNGTPVLASNLGGTPEMIAVGETGELFEAGNVRELSEKIRSLFYDEERLMAYHKGCHKTAKGEGRVPFVTLKEYCERLLGDVYCT